MVSKASDDLPLPDSPVMTMSRSRGSARSMFLRLCSRAPRMTISLGINRLAYPSAGIDPNRYPAATPPPDTPPLYQTDVRLRAQAVSVPLAAWSVGCGYSPGAVPLGAPAAASAFSFLSLRVPLGTR